MSQTIRFHSESGALRTAQDLHAALIDRGIEISLAGCREQMARRLGHLNWHELIKAISQDNRPGADHLEEQSQDRRAMVVAMADSMHDERRGNPIAFMTARQIFEYAAELMPISENDDYGWMWQARALHTLFVLARALVWLRDHRGQALTPETLRRNFAAERMGRMALPAPIAIAPYRDMPAEIIADIRRIVANISGFPREILEIPKGGIEFHPLAQDPHGRIDVKDQARVQHDGYLAQMLTPFWTEGVVRSGVFHETGGYRRVNAWLADAGREDILERILAAAPGSVPAELRQQLALAVAVLDWLRADRARLLTLVAIRRHLGVNGMARIATPNDLAPARYRGLPGEFRRRALDILRLVPSFDPAVLTGGWEDAPFSSIRVNISPMALGRDAAMMRQAGLMLEAFSEGMRRQARAAA